MANKRYKQEKTLQEAERYRSEAIRIRNTEEKRVEEAREHKIFDNAEIRMMINAFGCGFGNNIDLEKLRWKQKAKLKSALPR